MEKVIPAFNNKIFGVDPFSLRHRCHVAALIGVNR
jgi:hypothetical protein